jgi:hypothetical protein
MNTQHVKFLNFMTRGFIQIRRNFERTERVRHTQPNTYEPSLHMYTEVASKHEAKKKNSSEGSLATRV